MMEVYRTVSGTDKLPALFISNVRKLAGCKINEWSCFPTQHAEKPWTSLFIGCLRWQKFTQVQKKNKSRKVKLIKLCQTQRYQTQWAPKLQTAGGLGGHLRETSLHTCLVLMLFQDTHSWRWDRAIWVVTATWSSSLTQHSSTSNGTSNSQLLPDGRTTGFALPAPG